MFQKYIISTQRITSPRKPILHHFKTYTYKIYILIKSKSDPNKPKRFQKLTPRIYIGYLVGYESINIYKVWILCKKKIISVQDIIFNKEAFFNSKPIKIITKLITTLDKAINLIEIQSASDFKNIQL